MKKLLLTLITVAALNASAAITVSKTLAVTGNSNMLTGFNGSATVSQISLTSSSTNMASIILFDTPTLAQTYSNAAHTVTSSYVTNQITMWTNFFGGTNYMTNVALVDISTTVPAATNAYSPVAVISCPTNSTVTYSGTWNFRRGIWCTNTFNSSAAVSLTLTQ